MVKPAIPKSVFSLFAVTPPGLERVTAQELASLGFSPRLEPGGVSFKGTMEAIYLANLWLRTASRILVRVGSFKAQDFATLISRVSRYPWEIYLSEEIEAVRLRVTCHRSKLYHSGAVAERVLRGISSRLGRAISLTKEEDAPLIVVRLLRDKVLLRIDSSGQDLFKRGYKVAPGPAPLRENLAASLLFLSGWDQKSPLLDPFCGTGTIVIEAALLAANIAPGLKRSFAFEKWRHFEPDLWQSLKEKALKAQREPTAKIFGSDISLRAIEAARQNAQAAGVATLIHLEQKDFKETRPPATKGFLVTNPPYGERLSRSVYPLLGKMGKKRFSQWQITFLAPQREPPVGYPVRVLASFDHGGLKVFALRLLHQR